MSYDYYQDEDEFSTEGCFPTLAFLLLLNGLVWAALYWLVRWLIRSIRGRG